jgi:hypothetical protein
MVATERKSFWSPHPFFRYVCVGCGYRPDDRPTISPVNSGAPTPKSRRRVDSGQLYA